MSAKKFFSGLLELDLLAAGGCFVLLVALTFWGVFCRYLLNRPIPWQEEIQLWLFLWIVFFGGSAAFRNRSHVAIEILVEILPRGAQRALEPAVSALTLATLGFLAKYSHALVAQFRNTGKSTSVLQIPNALISAAIPVGCSLMMLNLLLTTIRDLRARKSAGDEEREATP